MQSAQVWNHLEIKVIGAVLTRSTSTITAMKVYAEILIGQ